MSSACGHGGNEQRAELFKESNKMSTAKRGRVGQGYTWLGGSPEQVVHDRQGERSRVFPSEILDSLFSDQGQIMNDLWLMLEGQGLVPVG